MNGSGIPVRAHLLPAHPPDHGNCLLPLLSSEQTVEWSGVEHKLSNQGFDLGLNSADFFLESALHLQNRDNNTTDFIP